MYGGNEFVIKHYTTLIRIISIRFNVGGMILTNYIPDVIRNDSWNYNLTQRYKF